MYLEDKGDLTFLAHTYLNHKKKLKMNGSHKFLEVGENYPSSLWEDKEEEKGMYNT